MRSFFTVACLVGCLVLTLVAPAAPVARAATKINAVHWRLDEPNKQIIVDVKLQFWNEYGCVSNGVPPAGADCQTSPTAPSPELIKRLTDGVLRYWNGHKYKCWDLVVHIDASSIANPQSASGDAVDIALVDTPVHVTPYVLGPPTKSYLGTDPADRGDPGREPGQIGAEWPTRATAPDYVYAHEFGHILGLDDNYNGDTGALLPGATPDLMWGQSDASRVVSEDMITRAVLRSGLPGIDKIKCPMTGDGGPTTLNLLLASLNDLTVHIYTCDYDPPSSDPKRKPRPMNWKGTVHLAGTYLTQVSIPGFPGASGAIDVPVDFTAEVPANGTGVLKMTLSKDVDVQVPVMWGADGNLQATEAAKLSTSGATLSTSYFFPGPPLMTHFVGGAAECPK